MRFTSGVHALSWHWQWCPAQFHQSSGCWTNRRVLQWQIKDVQFRLWCYASSAKAHPSALGRRQKMFACDLWLPHILTDTSPYSFRVLTLVPSFWNCACQGPPRGPSRKCLLPTLLILITPRESRPLPSSFLLGSSSLIPPRTWLLMVIRCVLISREKDTVALSGCNMTRSHAHSHQSWRTRHPGLNLVVTQDPTELLAGLMVRFSVMLMWMSSVNLNSLLTYLSKQLD